MGLGSKAPAPLKTDGFSSKQIKVPNAFAFKTADNTLHRLSPTQQCGVPPPLTKPNLLIKFTQIGLALVRDRFGTITPQIEVNYQTQTLS
jgi:hypothetical protein